jgi:predicted type IV restriction endonuclease
LAGLKIGYKIFGERRYANSAMSAYVDIMRALAARNPKFLKAAAERLRTATRNNLAQRRGDVYPKKRDLIDQTIELVPGWWLGTNLPNDQKIRMIKKACELEGLKFGKDIAVEFPTQHKS